MAAHTDQLDVWIWTPGQRNPVLAGSATVNAGVISFAYDPDFLRRPNAMSIFERDLPRRSDVITPQSPHKIAPSLRDALPDRWGRRAVAAGLRADGIACVAEDEIDDVTLMLRTGPDRIGGLYFCRVGEPPVLTMPFPPRLETLAHLVEIIVRGDPVPSELRPFLPNCTSVGGARPKALFTDVEGGRFIAKFGFTDDYPAVQAEFVVMRLAEHSGISVAPVQIERVNNRPVLLVKRFDRLPHPAGGEMRHHMVSALTWTQVGELSAHHITYPQLAAIMDETCYDPVEDKAEMFARICFNILVGNTDDHARNHGADWDGEQLHLTQAYDISPQRRTTRTANQAMALSDGSRAAQLANAAGVAPLFGVTGPDLRRLRERLVGAIREHWIDVCDEAGLSAAARAELAGRQFFNDFVFEGFGRTPRLR